MDEHILFAVNNYPPHMGGVQLHVQNLATRLLDAGCEVTVVCLSTSDHGEIREGGVRVIRRPRRLDVGGVLSFPTVGTTQWLASWARTHGVTAISTHTRFFPMTFAGVRAAQKLGIPSIHTEHGADFVRSPSLVTSVGSVGYDVTIGRQALRLATRRLAVSDDAAAFVRRLSGRDCGVFYNGIDVAAWATGRPVAPANRLVFIGRLVAGKGWREALTAAERLLAEFPDLRIDVLGEGPDLAAAQALAARLPDDVARFHGHVAPAKVAELLAGAVLVNASTLAEGFQLTVLEAVAAGGEVVSYPVPSARQLEGAQVRVVEPGLDSLVAGLRATLANRRGPADAAPLADWDWRAQADRYLDIVRESATHGASRARGDNALRLTGHE